MKALLEKSGYLLDPGKNVWAKPNYIVMNYSDGDETELRIGSIIEQATDVTVLSTELRRHCTDWPTLYHLSGTRANILRPFAASLSGKILEIGAGCGAITRYLGECGADVLALEGSLRRATIARSRTRDLENVTVLAEKFDDFKCDHKFDAITLIGVLEYANLFSSGEIPALSMLERVRALLKPQGKLIIAIENQLGLKYFAGAPEDHLGQPMYGIEGRYRKDQPQTFGRNMLVSILEKAGFSASEFLAPFPDYKLPVSIITEEGIKNKDFDASALAWQSARRDLQLPPYCNFSLELAWPEIFKNGMALDVANSFLIIASTKVRQLTEKGVLAYHYTTDRVPQYCKETQFEVSASDGIRVIYKLLAATNKNERSIENRIISFDCPVSAKYISGKLLSWEFVQIVTRDGWSIEEVGSFIKRYVAVLDTLAGRLGSTLSITNANSKLPGKFFDIIPQNIIIRADGSPEVIDTEWIAFDDIELGLLLFRAMLLMIASVTRFGNNLTGRHFSRIEFTKTAFDAAGFALSDKDISRFMEFEATVQEQVTGRSASEFLVWWPEQWLSVHNLSHALLERDGQISGLSQVEAERVEQISGLNQAVVERDGQIANLNQAVAERDGKVAILSQTVVERDGQITNLHQAVAERDGQVGNLNQDIAERDGQIANLNQTVAERDSQISELNQSLVLRDGQIANIEQTISENDREIKLLNLSLRRITAPLRLSKIFIDSILHPLRAYRVSRDIWITRNSSLFDVEYYLASNRDVRINSINPVRHYCEYGWKEGRNPSPVFNTNDYLMNNPDVTSARINPFVHYIKVGKMEGRLPLSIEDGSSNRITWKKQGLSIFSHVTMALLTLPSTWFHYSGLRNWVQAIGSGKSIFVAVLDKPGQSREHLAKMPYSVRLAVSVSLSVAVRIRRNGGVLPSLRNLYRGVRQEGLSKSFAQLLEHVTFDTVSARALPDPSRILVMDYRIPMADVSAGERATVGILGDFCAIGYDVVFLPNNMLPAAGYEEYLQNRGVTVITNVQGYQSSVHYLSQHGHTFAAFYLIRVDVAETVLDTIRQVAPQSKVIFHAPDVSFLRESREAEIKDEPTQRAMAESTKARELAIMSNVDHTVIVSPAELPVLRQYLVDTPISVFPVLYATVIDKPAPFKARKDIFFLGGFAHTPNIDAVCWFVGEVWPMVHQQLPEAVFHIVGSEIPQVILDLGSVPGIIIDGYVKELEPLLSSMRVGVAPLRYGAGIKGKVAMTMGAGIPCVCTSIAAEGMGVADGVHAIITDDPNEFAKAVTQIYTDQNRWELLSANGRALVRSHFGNEANRASLLSVLNAAKALPIALFIEHCKVVSPRPIPCPTEGESVDVSIIVPVYNQWEYTRVCLNSILETCHDTDIRYEIILADDGSRDKTTRAAKYYPGLRVIKTHKNVGFLRNCNNAVKHAKGKYLLLLNNDTVVLPGWLTALYQLMEEDESAAIVGSKLLYPDGTIQEAGAVLWNDGTACNCGRWDTAEYTHRREVDYVSGASFLVRKSFWDSVGGFDERYQNAYCEDSDLAMTARSKGMRVLFQPKSEVIHFEHKTYTEERRNYLLPIQRANIQRLCDKWRNELASYHLTPSVPEHFGIATAERSASPSTLVRRDQGHLNVLYFSPFPSHPSNHGNQATIQQFGRLFQSMGHKVHFALLQSHMFSDDVLKDMRAFWDTLDILPNLHGLGANGDAIPFDGWYEEGLGERVCILCAKYDIDVVFCSYVFQSKLLEFVPAHILRVIDTHDKMGNRYEMLRENGLPLEFFSCTPEEEGAYLIRADIVIARREEEAQYFNSITGLNLSIVIPHVEDPHFVNKTFSGPRNIGMVASANQINLTVTRECLKAIDRSLKGRDCPFTVHIAGQVNDMIANLSADKANVFQKPWVRMHGFVPDISKFYADMDLIVSPVTMGTGINVKTVQAMAYGMPLLTTDCGCKGIETGDPMHSHKNLDSLAESLFSLTKSHGELERLATVSRSRYAVFYSSALATFEKIHAHPKLHQRHSSTALSSDTIRRILSRYVVPTIENWGPQSMILDDIPNKQPNGDLGIWIRITSKQKIGEVQVLFDGQPLRTFFHEKIVTTTVPPEYLTREGKKQIVIKQILTGETFQIGTFVIDSKQKPLEELSDSRDLSIRKDDPIQRAVAIRYCRR